MPPKKNKKSSSTQMEALQWALRKRGVRPSGSMQQMEKKLAELKQEEERVRNMHKENANAKPVKGSNASNGSSVHKQKTNDHVEKRARHRSSSVSLFEERLDIVLWRRPIQTTYYFVREIPCAIQDAWQRFVLSLYDSKRKTIPLSRKFLIVAVLAMLLYGVHFVLCRDDDKAMQTRAQVYWFGYWVVLGILSSVGLGTGLHTFVLYLGPFIAKVALAAQECGTLEFPKPPYPDEILCPDDALEPIGPVSVFDIIAKVRWEALMWGFGTALGELPPFFMARAARVSGMVDDEDLEKFALLLQRKKQRDPKTLTMMERGKLFMEDLVEKVGFWGILACASIPNPLFDLAGITCGHFLVPFTTFFGATVIGKAIIKAHLQMAFVILAFNEELIDSVVGLMRTIPKFGSRMSEPFVEFMNHQKVKLHSKAHSSTEPGLLAFVLDKLVMFIVFYFIVSIINSMAQSYHKRICREKTKQQKL